MIVNNQLAKHMKGALKSMGLPQAKNKIVNALSKYKDTKPKSPAGTLSNYQLTNAMMSDQSQ